MTIYFMIFLCGIQKKYRNFVFLILVWVSSAVKFFNLDRLCGKGVEWFDYKMVLLAYNQKACRCWANLRRFGSGCVLIYS